MAKKLSHTMAILPTRALLIALAATPAAAAPLPLMGGSVTYAVVDQDLRDVLTEVTQQSGLRLNLSEAVHGRVRGRLPPAPFSVILDQLAKTYGFDWYYDGGVLYVSAASEAQGKMQPRHAGDFGPALAPARLGGCQGGDRRWAAPLRAARRANPVRLGAAHGRGGQGRRVPRVRQRSLTSPSPTAPALPACRRSRAGTSPW